MFLALLGACETPKPGTLATPLPGRHTERFPNGQGTFTLADGRRQTGRFRNDVYVGAQDGAGGDPNLVRVSASPAPVKCRCSAAAAHTS